MTGEFREKDARGTFFLQRVKREPLPFKTEEVSFQNGSVVLSGTLFIPLARGSHPAVVFNHGSVGEGRFASRFFADYLARRNIGAFIYDKPGVGKSRAITTQPFTGKKLRRRCC